MKGNGNIDIDQLRHMRHMAFQIMAQLPEDPVEAIAILEFAKFIYARFMDDTRPNLQVFDGFAKEA